MEKTEYYEKYIPGDLVNFKQWVAWNEKLTENGKTTKIPVDPKTGNLAKVNDPGTWGSFKQAIEYYKNNDVNGIGFVFSNFDEFVGIDLDNCIDPDTGQSNDHAKNIVDRLKSYTEISPSNLGLHIIVKGKIPQGARKKNGVELYDNKRFFTMTGNLFDSSLNKVKDRNEELSALYQELFIEPVNNTQKSINTFHTNDKILLNGCNNEKFNRLWNGDFHGYTSQSEADLALCGILNKMTNDPNQIDALFRKSGLYRPKWDEQHFAGGKTYGQETIEKAIQGSFSSFSNDFKLTDLGNAERLIHYHGDYIRYCHKWKSWYIWNGTCWVADDSDQIKQIAKRVVRSIHNERNKETDLEKAKSISKHAYSSESNRRIKDMISLAESERPIAPDDLDRDHWLLNCKNGTLDLRTGNFLAHNKENYISKLAPVQYVENAPCERWIKFLNRIMNGNDQLISFLQRAIGYALTGDTSEQCIFIFYGSGANGKSTFLQTIAHVLGDYAMCTPTETLLIKQRGAIPNDIARLKGARFVTASEAEAQQRLAESLIKSMTGGDSITARYLHGEWFDFEATYKIFLGTNHRPLIKGTDDAIWRRIKLIPFDVTIPEEQRDKRLFDKLKMEAEGIFSWAVQGCSMWHKNGLGEPEEVRNATKNYREEMDSLSEFFKDNCVLGPSYKESRKKLYQRYSEWCESNGQQPSPPKFFTFAMRERGFTECKVNGDRGWSGISVAFPLSTQDW